MNERTINSYMSSAQRKVIVDERKRISAAQRSAYEVDFADWKVSWNSGGLAMISNPNSRAVGSEYDALIAMGPVIIPLVVESLADPENFFALQLYDAIQPNSQLLVQYEPDDERVLEGEQGRAQRVVQTWFSNR